MNKGRIDKPSDGCLDRAYAACSACQCRRLKKNMHAVMSLDERKIIAWLCVRCAPSGG